MKTRQSDTPIQRKLLVMAIAGTLALLSSGAAIAQQTPTPQEGQAAPEDATTLDRVLVTANKRVENVRDVPVSISVITEEQLDNLHVTQLSDYAAYVPGLQVVSGGTPGQTIIALRGIAPISPGANIGTYIDETPVGSSGFYQRQTAFALDLLPYDIGRIEVLRGPQGTLYGAGAMGGLLKYVTRDPDLLDYEFRFGGGVSGVVGAADEGWDARFGANLPLVKDRFGLRIGYARNEIPGFIDNSVDGRQDINDVTQESARIAALWQLSDAASLKLTAMRQTIDSDNNAIVALDQVTQRPQFGDLTNTVFVDEPFTKDIDFYAATLEWDLGWADFTSASGYSDTSTFQRADATIAVGGFPTLFGLSPALAFFDLRLDLQKFTQEFRLTSKTTGRFEWQVGAFYTREEADNSQIVDLTPLDGIPYPPLPSPPFPDDSLDPLAVIALPSEYRETAIFANGSYEFSDRFELGAGVRFSRNKQDFAQVVTGGILLPIGTTPGSSEEDVFTWSLSPQFKLTDTAMLYARIATGYQPGGPNVALPGVPPSVGASKTTNYELGLKSEFADGRVLLDLAAFYIDWEDIQVSAATPDGLASFLTNGGEAVSKGIELSAAFKPTDRLRLGVNAAYTDATLSQDAPPIPPPNGFRNGLEGDRLPFIPEFSWSATADYYFPLGGDWNAHLGGGFRWVGERETGLTNTNPAAFSGPELDSYHALDLNADVSNGSWTFRAYMKNVTDERAYVSIGASGSALTPGIFDHLVAIPIRQRTVGLEVDYRF